MISSWPEIATRLRPFVARRVSPPDVDDVMQDIFVRMHRGLAALRDEERFTSWLFQIARTSIADHARTRLRHPLSRGDLLDALPAADVAGSDATFAGLAAARFPDPAADGDDREAARALSACISLFVAELASPYREAITLVELEGLTAREAAETVGISLTAMKSRVQRGRDQLRRLFEHCCEIALDARGKVTDFTPRRPACPACKP